MVQKNILAALLIFGIFMLIPRYMEMIGMGEQEPQTTSLSENDNNKAVPVEAENSSVVSKIPASSSSSGALVDIITIETPLYRAEISNQSGGSIVSYELLDVDGDEYRYLGSYNSIGEYDSNQNVVLMHNFNPSQPKCSPCLASEEGGQFVLHDNVLIANLLLHPAAVYLLPNEFSILVLIFFCRCSHLFSHYSLKDDALSLEK